MVVALSLLAAAAVVGLVAAAGHLRDRPVSLGTAAVHGVLAAAGLVAAVLAVVGGGDGLAAWALGLLVVAAVGGFALLASHLRGRPLPRGLVAVHGLAAAAGFVLLLVASMR